MTAACGPRHPLPGTPRFTLPALLLGTVVFSVVFAAGAVTLGDESAEFLGPALGLAASDDVQSTENAEPGGKSASTEEHSTTQQEYPTTEPGATEEPGPTEEPGSAENAETDAQLEPAEPREPVGEPLAPSMVELLQREILAGVKRRGIGAEFARFCRYAGARLDATARSSGSELNGKCRLDWYDHLLRNPHKAPAEAEAFTRQLHEAATDQRQGLDKVLAIAAEKLDLDKREIRCFVEVTSPEQALEVVRKALIDCQLAYCEALAPLGRQEIRELAQNLYPVMTSQNKVGHTLQNRGKGRRLCDLMERLDRNAMHAAAEALVPIADPKLLEQLKSLPTEDPIGSGKDAVLAEDDASEDDASEDRATPGVTGTIVRRIDTPSGAIVIGGKERNTYRLDKMPGVAVVIDLGGEDVYYEGIVSLHRPVLIVIDLDGNDAYRGDRPGVQGSAVMGISMLLDYAGNDVYFAKDVGQGSCLVGAGMLIDYAGNDTYVGVRRAQGVAIGGVGILIDRAGDDRYHAAMWAQGFGGPLGFGLLDDLGGKDHYYGGGLYVNSYIDDENPTPGYEGWAQGVGSGLRQVCDGGIGVILDGGGDDVYEFDYLSHGGGYWCGTGFARDFGGNDQRLGATRKAYAGGERTQRRFQRFGSGFGCHYALGFLFDDRGNDTYNGTIMCVGYAWDCSVGYLCDFGGSDRYSGNEGNGAQAGLGVVFDYDGNDIYKGYKQGRASSGISYHDLPQCGGNFSFVVDYGGMDKYGSRANNNSYLRRGSSGGFLIDRPKRKDSQEVVAKPDAKAAKQPTTKTATKPNTRTAAESGTRTAKQGATKHPDRTVRRLPPI